MSHVPHVLLTIVVASLAGALWAAIAGFLKATTGAHEVITTIMLNWIAYWIGSYLFGQSGPLQNTQNPALPVSNDVVASAKLLQPDCKTRRLMQLATGLCRCAELAAGAVQ